MSKLEVLGKTITGWKATAALIAIWWSPFLAGVFVGVAIAR